ncbi:MAG: RNA polymerase sigma-54 factor [Gammaproteobacteria bacterium]|jgi:RNA polymerase sigma-54 factor
MKQSLQLKLGQHLAMTPQLQQAIRLLQLSTMELQSEVQDALDSNLMLEMDDDSGASEDSSDSRSVSTTDSSANTNGAEEADIAPVDIPAELSVDSQWDDIYDAMPLQASAPTDFSDGAEVQRSSAGTLCEYLSEQLNLCRMSETDRIIGMALIDAIDDDGYLETALEDLLESLVSQGLDIELDEIEAVLHQVQQFEPAGVGAQNLSESLCIQLRQLPSDTPWRSEALELAADYIHVLGTRDYTQLLRLMRVEREDLQQIIGLIQTLHPRPGSLVADGQSEYVIPDVYVRKINGVWQVELNPDAFPRLRVNNQYVGMIRRADNSADNNTLKSHLQEARWFIKSLMSRSETLLKVATCIVHRQQGFLEHGDEAMKPMVLHDVAQAVEMHESTISRVTTNKYMHTPNGIYELKYFFSSHVFMKSGAECSSTAIRALLKKMIAAENPSKPLSDSKLANVLSDQGINVARRTVAKYRESLSIPSSTERKELG